MNILFLTLSCISDISKRGIYTDLMREFIQHGHTLYIISPIERRLNLSTSVIENGKAKILRVKTLNIQKTNIIEKGIGTLLLESQYQRAINKYWKGIKFDLVLYSTPPITFNKVIASLKKSYGAKTYLLLKDIFPQNAVDLGMFSKRSLIYKIFRRKETKLYQLSDYIGCMSPANVEYLLKHNLLVKADKVEICPNSISLLGDEPTEIDKISLFQKYNIPTNKVLFIYGGNLGRPQGIDFLIKILIANEMQSDIHFIIAGNGTEYKTIKKWFDKNNPHNTTLLPFLEKQEYDTLIKICDIGLIFLDKRFTIPNYPSRLLSYLENRLPVLMAIDQSTDIGKIAEKNGYGLWVESGKVDEFMRKIDFIVTNRDKMKAMGNRGYEYLVSNYTVESSYRIIMKHFE